jgi:hypothetical protein
VSCATEIAKVDGLCTFLDGWTSPLHIEWGLPVHQLSPGSRWTTTVAASNDAERGEVAVQPADVLQVWSAYETSMQEYEGKAWP